MTNREIRKLAWKKCKENFWRILSASFLTSLISTLLMNLSVSTESVGLVFVAEIALIVLSVLMSLGMVRFILDIWHEQPTSLSVLFSQKRRFWTCICSGLLIALIAFGVMIPFILLWLAILFTSEMIVAVLCTIAIIADFVLLFWIMLRYEMITTCIVLNPSMRATECMRTVWRASKGNVGRLFCNGFVLNLPLLAAQALLIGYQTFLTINGQALNTFGSLLLDAASLLISALLSGYIALGTYALHEQLLNSCAPAQPEAEAPIELPMAETDSDENN